MTETDILAIIGGLWITYKLMEVTVEFLKFWGVIDGGSENMKRLTQTSDKGGVAFTFDLDITCEPLEAQKILRLAEKLKEYEDAEEQGLLLKLPCKIGDNVYRCSHHGAYIDICSITGIAECDSLKFICYTVYIDPDEEDVIALSEFGETVFLTMEEADEKQKKLQQ